MRTAHLSSTLITSLSEATYCPAAAPTTTACPPEADRCTSGTSRARRYVQELSLSRARSELVRAKSTSLSNTDRSNGTGPRCTTNQR